MQKVKKIGYAGVVLTVLLSSLPTQATRLDNKHDKVVDKVKAGENKNEPWHEALKIKEYQNKVEVTHDSEENKFSITVNPVGVFSIQGDVSLFIKEIKCGKIHVNVKGDVLIEGSIVVENEIRFDVGGDLINIGGFPVDDKKEIFDRQKFLIGVEIWESEEHRHLKLFRFGCNKIVTMKFPREKQGISEHSARE